MQNEKDYLIYCTEFEHIQQFGMVFQKIVGALLAFAILDNNLCSCIANVI